MIANSRLGEIFQRTEKADRAIAAYEAVLKDSPQNIPVTMRLVELYSAKDPQKALALAKIAYRAAPNDPAVAHELARLAYATGDYPWSLSLLQLTARNLPTDPEVLYDLGAARSGRRC